MLAFLLALLSAIAVPPKPAKYVTDNAGVLNAARASALNEKLAQFERDTSNQILVYVDRSLPADTTIEQFANDAFHQWRVGQKGKDNGAVLFLFINDRKMRIEVGYGLEGVLTDAKTRGITSTVIRPRLLANDYDGAVEQGVDAILATARGEELKGTGATVHETKKKGVSDLPVTCFAFLAVVIIGFIMLFVLIRKYGIRGRNWGGTPNPNADSSSWSSSSSSSSDSYSDSSSSSDSSFDGGGGDSGGGGSSDSW
jgi:uncharacterized protein